VKIYIEKDYAAMSKRAAEWVEHAIRSNPQLVLGLATGSTPLGMYRHWIQSVAAGTLSFKNITSFNLDEYLGLSAAHPSSYRMFMEEQLFRQIDIDPSQTHVPNGDMEHTEDHCREYDRLIEQAGGIDIQILGIGENGHIGFNEPGEDFGRLTHVVRLSDSTRRVNSRFFNTLKEVPTHAVTMGLKNIMNARQVVVLASGDKKSRAVEQALLGKVTEHLPASVLQLHPDCVFILDEAAACRLPDEVKHNVEMAR
jgi:glucosamine-6-phosphate deaminase